MFIPPPVTVKSDSVSIHVTPRYRAVLLPVSSIFWLAAEELPPLLLTPSSELVVSAL